MASSTQPSIIVDAEGIFRESDWIGVNKKYQDVPPEVLDARDTALKIPEVQSKHIFPPSDLPVTKSCALDKVFESLLSLTFVY